MTANERTARAALSRLMEPQDAAGLALVRAVGAEDALRIATGQLKPGPSLEQEITGLLADAGAGGGWLGLGMALKRWAPRVPDLAPARDLATMQRLGGRLLIPSDQLWPAQLADLGLQEPLCLWWRGVEQELPPPTKAVALVGSRDSTSYGSSVTADLAYALAQRGFTIVSGGAYGIDAHAHRAALAGATGLPTIAVMAGGVDRFYPSGNEDLLRTVANQGAVLAEVPPGSAPTRYRFLQRNRIIAALAGATVVVEARWRSGALNTAHHAETLGRSVGAVPGSVHSANSAGCHRLLREGGAVCVTDAAEIAELVSPSGDSLPDPAAGRSEAHDGLTLEDLILLDALPLRVTSTVEKLAVVAGLSPESVRAGLGRLGLVGLAESRHGGWKRSAAAG
ncbi:DNA-processing protein DprA [Arthrobacter sp. YD4]|uniref:DNA-processing protein DprA n=1 Tax=Arthrobacter sp. YD4 TaxID=3058043 RepID=UPI0025B5842A|nr:DNA-processing protein DprA [Arthrobacter sp. YD4]MDN3936543.1 DNA-processing protein DprA [Arthrobacter sp. YD4]